MLQSVSSEDFAETTHVHTLPIKLKPVSWVL